MFTLRPTVALAKRAKVELPPRFLPVTTPYADWCAHTFTAQQFRYLILTNTYSLLSTVTRGAGTTSKGQLVIQAFSAIDAFLRESGRTSAIERFIEPVSDEVQLARIPDRSVVGSVNELIFLAKCHLIEGGLSPIETSHRLSQVPLSALWKRGGPSSPDLVFASMPGSLPT